MPLQFTDTDDNAQYELATFLITFLYTIIQNKVASIFDLGTLKIFGNILGQSFIKGMAPVGLRLRVTALHNTGEGDETVCRTRFSSVALISSSPTILHILQSIYSRDEPLETRKFPLFYSTGFMSFQDLQFNGA